MKLGSIALEAGHRLINYRSVGSTNAEALTIASSRITFEPLWITAATQTAGRGRQGREWSSPPGNFYGSLLLTNPCEMHKAAQLGFVAGVAVITALKQIAPSLQLSLKWPNDILLNKAKLAGILLETSHSKKINIAVGIGINLAFNPDNTPYPATNCATHGFPVSFKDCLTALSNAFTQKLELFERGNNFADIRDEWLKNAHPIHTPLNINIQTHKTMGTFGGINETGSLILNQDKYTQLIHAGDVYFSN